jgi:hypothetical protein
VTTPSRKKTQMTFEEYEERLKNRQKFYREMAEYTSKLWGVGVGDPLDIAAWEADGLV